MADKLTDDQRQGLRDFQASANGILTPADYFVAGIVFASGTVKHDYHDREDSLLHCKVCNGGEGSLPTDCPGERMTDAQEEAVYAGTLDFREGRWVDAATLGAPVVDEAQPVGFIRPDKRTPGRFVFINFYEGRNPALAWEPVYQTAGVLRHPS